MLLVPIALGIEINYDTNDVSSSNSYNLDKSTFLELRASLGDDSLSQTDRLSGSGSNAVSQQVAGYGYSTTSTVGGMGEISASLATSASSEGAQKSSNLAGNGILAATLSGVSVSASVEETALAIGNIESSQSVIVGQGISASTQNTKITGDAGITSSSVSSKENALDVSANFLGSGDLNTEHASIAGDRAEVHGTTSINDQVVINDNVVNDAVSNSLSVSADGIYEDRNGDLGQFGVAVTNTLKSSQNDIGFKTGGWAWSAPIHYKLSTNLISADKNLRLAAISKGCNEWDKNTAKNIFKGSDSTNTAGTGNVLELTSFVPTVGKYNGGTGDGNKNYQSWTKSVTGSTIAVTYTWYYTNKYVTGWDGDKYYKAAESNVYYNANKGWRIASGESTATNSKFDIRTIATHEVGHSLGLLDLYGSTDTNKIMYGYNNGQVKWKLRNADKLGVWTLYGV